MGWGGGGEGTWSEKGGSISDSLVGMVGREEDSEGGGRKKVGAKEWGGERRKGGRRRGATVTCAPDSPNAKARPGSRMFHLWSSTYVLHMNNNCSQIAQRMKSPFKTAHMFVQKWIFFLCYGGRGRGKDLIWRHSTQKSFRDEHLSWTYCLLTVLQKHHLREAMSHNEFSV